MAALTATLGVESKVPWGRYFAKRFTFTVANTGAADEWISTGFSEIIGVLSGPHPRGTTKGSTNYVLNAQGTGVTAGTNNGDLGVESDVAAVHEVVVIGR